ncbi:MAG: diphosphate--fructose-6-phosphate 1-phosphotransferase [Chloroflexi bacterium]|nr:diphosphate--fructose-6-phosphate 1-phosphotransferase [Chloroflexota bacterium]MDA1228308.1 diphosphate--fructose-6-phosphate 1-phosphotransferase [Chloroflexota bacterium]
MNGGNKRIGILVGGGPAPGINSAISACVIEAANKGIEVIGILDGFSHLMKGRTDMTLPLTVQDVALIHAEGGSILRTSRANPTTAPGNLKTTINMLRELGVSHLVSIGGEDTALSASQVALNSDGDVRVAHIPKTIDNDLPLPGGIPTFGYETARHVGTQLVLNLMEDSRTTNRWFVVVVMGRKAGHLALGIGKAAGAALTLIPEEFPDGGIGIDDVVKVIEGAMLKRKISGRDDGVAVIAEGVAEKLDPEELARLAGVDIARDPHGHIRLGEIPVAAIIRREVQKKFAQLGEDLGMVDVTVGYELRCAPPIPFDIDYTRTLGYGAIQFLLSEPTSEKLAHGGLVYMEDGNLSAMPFEDMRDEVTGKTRIRVVDTASQYYEVAREYMTRLESSDLDDEDKLSKLAEACHKTPDEVRARFASVV